MNKNPLEEIPKLEMKKESLNRHTAARINVFNDTLAEEIETTIGRKLNKDERSTAFSLYIKLTDIDTQTPKNITEQIIKSLNLDVVKIDSLKNDKELPKMTVPKEILDAYENFKNGTAKFEEQDFINELNNIVKNSEKGSGMENTAGAILDNFNDDEFIEKTA
ncbi:hypothetical protein KAJ89_00050 [Candidatus Parcubacteria bacterium]|nr:hypothetical protein [Candidatus Parcubacteria bacterium]